jgi:hypothetical protein
MFYEVTITNPKIRKKKIISSKELSDNYWSDFEKKQNLFSKKNNLEDVKKKLSQN